MHKSNGRSGVKGQIMWWSTSWDKQLIHQQLNWAAHRLHSSAVPDMRFCLQTTAFLIRSRTHFTHTIPHFNHFKNECKNGSGAPNKHDLHFRSYSSVTAVWERFIKLRECGKLSVHDRCGSLRRSIPSSLNQFHNWQCTCMKHAWHESRLALCATQRNLRGLSPGLLLVIEN